MSAADSGEGAGGEDSAAGAETERAEAHDDMGVGAAGGGDADVGADSLTGRTLSGLKWVYAGTAAGLVAQLIYTAIMNRLLDPVEFGLIASAQVVLRFGKYVSELGLGPALVQRKDLTTLQIRAAVTSSALLGAALTVAMFFFAPALEVFFDSPDVVPVFRALAVTLLLNTLTIVPVSLLSRDLRFKAVAGLEFFSFVVAYFGGGLVVALLGGGVWSLVTAAVTQPLLMAIGAQVMTKPPSRPSFAFGKVSALYSFGGKVSVITLMEYGLAVVPPAVVGRFSGIEPLGQFNRAALVIELPLVSFTYGLSRVLFPALSKIQGDRERVREVYLTAMRTSGGIIVPVAAGAGVAGPELVGLLLGPQWGTAGQLVPALAAAAALGFLAHYGGIVCEALDVLNVKIVIVAFLLAGLIGGMLLVPDGDLQGYALTLAVVQGLAALFYALLMGRVLTITLRQQLGIYVPTFLAGAVVAAGIWAVTEAAGVLQLPLAVVVPLQMLTGALVLALLAWFGPLRPVRFDVIDRLQRAGLSPDSSAIMRRAFAVLAIGGPDRRSPEHQTQEVDT